MDAILNNPFRILGLPTTASDKEIVKRVSDLLIYAEMGKKVSYETDFPFLGEIDRSIESIKHAAQKIGMPENKIFYSLLCFDLKDKFEKESIEYIKQGNFEAAINVLKNEIFNICPVVYSPEHTVSYILRNFTQTFHNTYAITLGPPRSIAESVFTKIFNNYFVNIYQDCGIVDIQESYTDINLTDKYQISCRFKWVETDDSQDVSIGLGFIDSVDAKYFIRLSINGVISFFKSNHLEIENEINKTIFHETKSNYLALKRYDNYIEVRLNSTTLLKIDTVESFHSAFLCLSGKQTVLIEDLCISSLIHWKKLAIDDEINENTFSYSKNIALISLIEILKRGKIGSSLQDYFVITGNFLKKPYFISYTKEIISNNYLCNFEKLTDIFVREFYLSLNHLIDPNEQYSQFSFYNSFKRLSDDAEKKIKDFSLGYKPYTFVNFIKETTEKRNKEPQKSYDFACDLKNESTYFSNLYSQFYGSYSIELKSISDKIGTEILECSISYYNSINPKGIELARQTLKLLTWASDFAFNQQIRDRINENISVLLKKYEIFDYKIIDFDEKDRTRDLGPFSIRGNKKNVESNKTPIQGTSDSKNEPKPIRTKSDTTNRPITLPINKPRVGKQILQIFVAFVFKYFFLILFVGVITYFVLTDKSEAPQKSPNNQINSNNSRSNNTENYSLPKEESKWKGNKLQNGLSPYDSFFGKGLYDYNSKCWVTFKNGNSTEAVVCLENATNGRTIRNEYIQAGTNYKMSNVPEGVYKVKIFQGNDWNPEKTLKDGLIRGTFDTDLSFSLSDDSNDLINITITRTSEGISYSTHEITLYTVNNGNMNQRKINSDEFFK